VKIINPSVPPFKKVGFIYNTQIIQLNIPLFPEKGIGEITKINFPISIL